MIKSTHRFDLDGQEAGEITAEHKQVARDELTRRRAKHQERQAQEEVAQRQRFELLRAFETTTLTRANFCALKGLAEDRLDGLLTLAREEAKARAARPRAQEGGRPGSGDRRGAPGADRRGGRPGRPDDRRPGRGPGAKGAPHKARPPADRAPQAAASADAVPAAAEPNVASAAVPGVSEG